MTDYFDPVQPFFVFHSDCYYKKIIAHLPVAHFYRFTCKNQQELQTIQNTVVPDGAIDVIFSCNPYQPTAFVAGSVEVAGTNIFQEQTSYFGVRFLPGISDHFGKISAKEIVGVSENFVQVTGRADVMEKICTATSFEQQIAEFMTSFEDFINADTKNGNALLVAGILQKIFQDAGNLKIQDLENILHYSRRHLVRVFTDFTGMNIKHFSNIIRFQKALTAINHGQYSSIVDISMQNGYYDQTHFQKDFRKFARMTPGNYCRLIDGIHYLNRITMIK
ncbi:MAG: AraC family transcriptional regulator [Oscillospiraceae bacterium]|nr:AraC family transcriptional regulator [Oscillospiraceae bacterium]